jgi:thioredoxin 1
MSDGTKAVTDQTFETDVLQANHPVVVDFWADWCGPCQAIAPALEEIAKDFAGRVTIAKVNVDENPVTPNRYAVRGIPTMILFKDGKAVDRLIGGKPKGELRAWVESQVA